MLTALRLGNFKAFGETQTIPIRPLTLIFGPNSGGKSSLIHGLLLAQEARRCRNFDINHTQVGGTSVDLGGFPQYVYRHNPKLTVEWGIEGESSGVQFGIGRVPTSAKTGQGTTAGIRSVSISLGGEPLLRALRSKGGKTLRVNALNCSNTCLVEQLKSDWLARLQCPGNTSSGDEFWQIIREKCEAVSSEQLTTLLEQNWRSLKLSLMPTAFLTGADYAGSGVNYGFRNWQPRDTVAYQRLLTGLKDLFDQHQQIFMSSLEEQREEAEESLREKLPISTSVIAGAGMGRRVGGNRSVRADSALAEAERVLDEIPEDCDKDKAWEIFLEQAAPLSTVSTLLQKLIEEAVENVTELDRLDYLGPLRSFPSRHLTLSEQEDSNWRAGGGSAWDVLLRDTKVRKKVNEWLGKLSSPYRIDVREFREKKTQAVLKQVGLFDRNSKTLVTHRDVGIGVSQVLPVLVRALGTRNQIHCIEQPEIHLHPALQAELGDVFIQSALGKNENTFLLETHSEHLILRIMRCMRETARKKLRKDMPKVRPDDVSILYVKPSKQGSVVYELRLDEEGQLIDPWPGGFFEEGFRERFSD